MLSELISQASSCLSDLDLVAGTTFDKLYDVVTTTGVLGIDGDMSPRSVDRSGKHWCGRKYCTETDRMETFHDLRQKQLCRSDDFSSRNHSGCYRDGSRTKLVMVGKCHQCLCHLAASGSHDFFHHCVRGMVRHHQRDGRWRPGHT